MGQLDGAEPGNGQATPISVMQLFKIYFFNLHSFFPTDKCCGLLPEVANQNLR